jgi:leucyl/phenylalanyl-tRNA--protein transferase
VFPPPAHADPSGVLGVGGDLHPDRVLLAYQMGIFPWYSEDQPLLWWSPDPRFVLEPTALRVSRSLHKRLRQRELRITMDTALPAVLAACATSPRPGQLGTWLTRDLRRAFRALHERGHVHSVEAWRGDRLVGGLYGVAVGRVFCGESMFAREDDASKVAFVWLVRQLHRWGFPLVDCQVHTPHLARFGAVEVPRRRFLSQLARLGQEPGRPGPWSFDADFDGADPPPSPPTPMDLG